MEFLSNHFLNANFPQILFWTFIHSFWQAAFLAILAGSFMWFTKRTKPHLRYNGLIFLFISFILCNCITFFYLWGKNEDTINFASQGLMDIPFKIKMGAGFFHFLYTYSNLLFLLWLIIFLIKSIQLGKAFRQIHQIKHQEIQFPDAYWKVRFQTLLETLKINKQVQLATSKISKIPATIGLMKPLVLVPIGLFSNLPPDQVEVILLHELAHIKRNDYLVNSIQKIIETIFFFNPFLLWVSKLIRTERENCCDEIAIAHVKDKKALVEALINFEELQQFPVKLAMNFGREKGQILNRVKRIVLNQNTTLNNVEKAFVTISLFLFLGWFFTFSRTGINIKSYPQITQNKSVENKKARTQIVLQDIVIESINLSSTQDTLKVATAITEDLIKDGIIQNTESLSYKLDNDELIVNGIKQPIVLHQKLREKYIHEQGWSVFYTQKQKSTVNNMS